MIWLLLLLALLVVAVVVVMVRGRGGRHHEPGVVNFRRHIDALSPEARREVMDRVRAQREPKEGK